MPLLSPWGIAGPGQPNPHRGGRSPDPTVAFLEGRYPTPLEAGQTDDHSGRPQKRDCPGPPHGEPGQSGEEGTLVSPAGLPGRPVDPEGEGGDPWVQLPYVFVV